MRITARVVIALVLVGNASGVPRAQSLADVARVEAARRKASTAAVKVYTNDDLGGTLAPAAPAPDSKTAVTQATPAKESQKPAAVDETKTEKYWKERAAAIQQSLERNKTVVAALQSQVSGLNAEALNTDDPGQRGLLQKRLQTATAELDRVQRDIEQQTKAAAALQEEARKANVPPGWLR